MTGFSFKSTTLEPLRSLKTPEKCENQSRISCAKRTFMVIGTALALIFCFLYSLLLIQRCINVTSSTDVARTLISKQIEATRSYRKEWDSKQGWMLDKILFGLRNTNRNKNSEYEVLEGHVERLRNETLNLIAKMKNNYRDAESISQNFAKLNKRIEEIKNVNDDGGK